MMNKSKKQKQKRTPISHRDCLLVTALTIEECLSRIDDMENTELEVRVQQEESDYAEVQFMERHKDDLAIYGVSRLVPLDANRTCVTFERILKRHSQMPSSASIKWLSRYEKLDKSIIWMVLLFWAIISMAIPQATPALFVLAFIVLSIGSLRHIPEQPTSQELIIERESHLKEQQREDELRADLYHILWLGEAKTKVDELGDAYYVESPKPKTGYES